MGYFWVGIIAFISIVLFVKSQWANPTNIIAVGSILGGSVSAIALAYNFIQQAKNSRVESKMKFAEFLPHSKRVLSMDLERAVASCPGADELQLKDISLLRDVDAHVLSIVENKELLEKLEIESKNPSNVLLIAALNGFRNRYEELRKEAVRLDAEIYFNILVRDVGYGIIDQLS